MTTAHPVILQSLQELASEVEADPELQEEATVIHHVLTQLSRYQVKDFHEYSNPKREWQWRVGGSH